MLEPNTNEPLSWQKILSRYSSIWIWSIIIGLNSTMFVSFYNYRPPNFGTFGLVLLVFDMSAFICSIFSWMKLFQILRSVILPIIFPVIKKQIDEKVFESNDEKEYFERNERRRKLEMCSPGFQSKLFEHAFYFLLMAFFFKFFSCFAEGAFNSLMK